MFASDLKHTLPSLEEKLQQLFTLNRDRAIDLDFRPVYLQLLQQFGNPHQKLPPVIHVAGTNGKGSTVALLRAIFEAAGYKVHAYTSPHLCTFNERIVLAGETITDAALESLVNEALELNNGNDVTFFEITTAMAFAAFSRAPADVLLLETGLGGRLDCTNIIENPVATIITNISWDHMEHLGQTLEKIAVEKAGIIKKNVPCITGPQGSGSRNSGVMDVLNETMNRNNSAPCRHGAEWSIEPQGNSICFTLHEKEFIFPNPALIGDHQIGNAGTAIAAVKILQNHFRIPDDAIASGLQNVQWPARLQQITSGPLTKFLPPGWELFLDGGHNSGAAEILAKQAENWKLRDSKPLYLVLAMMNHKDPADFIKPLRPHLAGLYAMGIPGEPKALSASVIVKSTGAIASNNLYDALSNITRNAVPGRILIAGSLYMAGHVLKEGHK